jgi:hypothetical protein
LPLREALKETGHQNYTQQFERSGEFWGGVPVLTSEPVTTREDLIAAAARSLGFLEQSGRGPARRTDHGDMTRPVYPLGETFVELELDWREQAVFVLVGRCRDGRIPDGYYVDSHGTVVRHHLGKVLITAIWPTRPSPPDSAKSSSSAGRRQ